MINCWKLLALKSLDLEEHKRLEGRHETSVPLPPTHSATFRGGVLEMSLASWRQFEVLGLVETI